MALKPALKQALKPGDLVYTWSMDKVWTAAGGLREEPVIHKHRVDKVGRKWATFDVRRFDVATLWTERHNFGDGGSVRVYLTRAAAEANIADAVWMRENSSRVRETFAMHGKTPVSTWRRVVALLDQIEAEKPSGQRVVALLDQE